MAHSGGVALPVPFVSRLSGPLTAGQTLVIHGRVMPNAKRFEVNLLSGAPDIDNHMGSAPLHCSIRFDEKKIVLNTFQGGEWGKEERHSNPFKVGEPFDLRIRAHEDKFEVSADQKEIAEFKSRQPLSSIQFFTIKGEVTLKGVHWGGRYYNLPHEQGFEGGHLRSGARVFIYGIPTGDRFEIDLLGRNGDILFHYNPRMGEKKVVRNAMIGGTWGAEEREGQFPFKKNIGFDLAIQNEPYSIQIYEGGEHLGTFAHRTGNPNQDYVGLRVAGNLELTAIEFSHH